MNGEIISDLGTAKKIRVKEGCCKSYLTPKGRCYSCPEERMVSEDKE